MGNCVLDAEARHPVQGQALLPIAEAAFVPSAEELTAATTCNWSLTPYRKARGEAALCYSAPSISR